MARERRTSTSTSTPTKSTSTPSSKTSPIRISTRSSSAKTPNTATTMTPRKTITPKSKSTKTPTSVFAGKRKRSTLQTPSKSPSNPTKTQSPTKRHSPRRAKLGAIAVSEALSSLSSSKSPPPLTSSASSSFSSPISTSTTTNTAVASKKTKQANDESPTKAKTPKKVETLPSLLQETTPYSRPPKVDYDAVDDAVGDAVDYSEPEPEDHQYDENPFNSDEPSEDQSSIITTMTDTKITPPKSSIFFKHLSHLSPSASSLIQEHSPTVRKTVVVSESPLRMATSMSTTTTNESPKTPLLQKVNSILKWLMPTEEERKEWAENGERILKIGKNVALTIKTTLMDTIATTVSPEEVEDYSGNGNGGGNEMNDGATIITEYPSLSPILDDVDDADISTMMVDTDAPLAAEPVNFGGMDIVDKHIHSAPAPESPDHPTEPPNSSVVKTHFSSKTSAPPQLSSSPKDLSNYFKAKRGMLSRDEYTKLQNIILAMGRSDVVSNGAGGGGGSFLSSTTNATNKTAAINNLPQHGRHPTIRKSRTFSARFDDDDQDEDASSVYAGFGSAPRPSASFFKSNSLHSIVVERKNKIGGDGRTHGDDRGRWSTIIKKELIDSQKRHMASAKPTTAAPVKSFVTSGVYNGGGGADSFSTITANNTSKAAAAVTADSLKESTFSITLPTPPTPPPQPTELEENTSANGVSKGMFAFYGGDGGDNANKTELARTVGESKPFSFGYSTAAANNATVQSKQPFNSSLLADKKPFTYGGFPETKVDNAPSFSFGSSSTTLNTTAAVGDATSNVKEQLEPKKPFSFGSTTTTTAAEPKANPFTFGSANVETNTTAAGVSKANTASPFTFGTTSCESKLPNAFGSSTTITTASESKPFTFGSSTNSSSAETPKPFTFGSSNNNTSETPKPFTFGSSNNNTSETPKPFTFGSSTTASESKPFTFGSTTSNTEAPKPFTFGSSTTASESKPFTFGSTTTTSATDVKPLTFGGGSDNPFGHAIPSSPINSSSNLTQQPPGSSSPLPDGPLSKKFHPSPSPLTFSFGATSTGGGGGGGQQGQTPSQTPQQQDQTRKFSVPLTRRRR